MHGFSNARLAILSELPLDLEQQVARALAEDIGKGDVTAALVPASQQVSAQVITRENAVICGTAWVDATFQQLDPSVHIDWLVRDGQQVAANATLFKLRGPARSILTGERTALNFLQLLSATASAAQRYVAAVAGTGCQILDTRKTLPGLRTAQKYAARCGGARNHRIGLYDMVLIKENHIAAAGSIEAAIGAARRQSPGIPVEIEVESLREFDRALIARPDIIMLDELAHSDLIAAVQRNQAAGRPCKLEASGGVSLATIRAIAETGVDYISVGAITKHVQAIDLSMRLEFSTS